MHESRKILSGNPEDTMNHLPSEFLVDFAIGAVPNVGDARDPFILKAIQSEFERRATSDIAEPIQSNF